jgi:hypothetical protein
MRAAGLHPETSEPLEEKLRDTILWLFPDAPSEEKPDESKEEDSRESNRKTDHIKVEGPLFGTRKLF